MKSHSTSLPRSPRVAPRLLATISSLAVLVALIATPGGWGDAVSASDLAAPPADAASAPSAAMSHSGNIYFAQTGHSIQNGFLSYWLWHGQVAGLGYPLTEEVQDGGLTVQYFERARLEYNAKSGAIRPGTVGTLLTADRDFPKIKAFKDTKTRAYYPATGHSIGGGFFEYFKKNGGLATFGNPLSEEFRENGHTVQYFERARFELNKGKVQLGRIGAELMQARVDAKQRASRQRPAYQMSFNGGATWFPGQWDRIISLNKSWGNLPRSFTGQGLYAAMPADLHLYGRWGKVTKNGKSIWVQFVDVINWPDIAGVRADGKVIDLGTESFQQFAPLKAGVIRVTVDVAWPGEGPNTHK